MDLLELQNPKGSLQEFTQKNGGLSPKYITTGKTGPEHNPIYAVICKLASDTISEGRGKTLKLAQEDAARRALKSLKEKKS